MNNNDTSNHKINQIKIIIKQHISNILTNLKSKNDMELPDLNNLICKNIVEKITDMKLNHKIITKSTILTTDNSLFFTGNNSCIWEADKDFNFNFSIDHNDYIIIIEVYGFTVKQ